MDCSIRPINRSSDAEVRMVAERMRATLVEVLGRERGEAMYTLEWLEARVRFHLDPVLCDGAVLVAESSLGEVVGHTIVRREQDDGSDNEFGLFSTIYVLPSARRFGIASRLLEAGEGWFGARNLTLFKTYTDENNQPLIRLFERHGYRIAVRKDEFVILEKFVGQA